MPFLFAFGGGRVSSLRGRATFARGGKSSQKRRLDLRSKDPLTRYTCFQYEKCSRGCGFPISLSVKRTVPPQLSAAASLTLKTATVGGHCSTVLGDYQIAPKPLRGRGFGRWRLAPPGGTDPHASDVGHWLGMTALRAGGMVARRRTLRHLSLRGAKRRGNPRSPAQRYGFPRQCEHWLGMTEGQIAMGAERPRNDRGGRRGVVTPPYEGGGAAGTKWRRRGRKKK